MKNRKSGQFLLAFIFFIALPLVLFYFWGKSSNYEADYYSQIKHYLQIKAPELEPDTLTVLTYNIGYLSGMDNNLAVQPDRIEHLKRNREAKELMIQLNANLIAFQEIDFLADRSFRINQFDSLGQYSGFINGAYAVNWDKKYVPFPYWPPEVHFGRMLSGQGLLSTMPILSNKRIVLPKPKANPFYYNAFYLDRILQVVELQTRHGLLYVLNVHLEAFDEETRIEQARIVTEIVKEYMQNNLILLMGDFNARPGFDSLIEKEPTIPLILRETGLKSAVDPEEYLGSPEKHYTFSSAEPYEKIDYIFYDSTRIEMIDSRVVHEAGSLSDHLPVLMKFIIKSN